MPNACSPTICATYCSVHRSSRRAMTEIEQLLQQTMGLDAASIGSTLIQRTVRLRMKAFGFSRAEDYRHLLEKSRAEWIELVESVLVTETWFFRDRPMFAALVRQVLEVW